MQASFDLDILTLLVVIERHITLNSHYLPIDDLIVIRTIQG